MLVFLYLAIIFSFLAYLNNLGDIIDREYFVLLVRYVCAFIFCVHLIFATCVTYNDQKGKQVSWIKITNFYILWPLAILIFWVVITTIIQNMNISSTEPYPV